jgi:hypothetical protein
MGTLGTFRLRPPTLDAYPKTWVEDVFECECGVKCRVHFEDLGPTFSSQPFQHPCGRGQEKWMPGRIFGAWEERVGQWIFIPQQV